MNVNQKSLDEAIIAYVAYGKALSPRQDRRAVLDAYGSEGEELVVAVERIIGEATSTPIDWSENDLVSAGKHARAVIHDRYPFLSSQALDAIEWKFTFDWR